VQNKSNKSAEKIRSEKTVHLALPVRWSLVGQDVRGPAEVACTYDIHPNGARLVSSRKVNIGDLVMVERGRNKAVCQVVWVAEPASSLRGQFAVRCVEGKTPWDEELRQTEEEFQPVDVDALQRGPFGRIVGPHHTNRRRRPRYHVEGQAEVIDRVQHLGGEVIQISEFGARITSNQLLRPGTDCRLMLNLFDVSLALKAQVKYLVNNFGMGVEFQEIRRGDRPLLGYVLSKLKGRPVEEFVEVEVITDRIAAAIAG
jgi:hypothetical protein